MMLKILYFASVRERLGRASEELALPLAVADIAGGYAGLTVTPEGMEVVTAEYKINFLGSYQGGGLRAIGRVVKPGKRLIIATAEVTHVGDDGQEGPCALMQQTLVPVPKTY